MIAATTGGRIGSKDTYVVVKALDRQWDSALVELVNKRLKLVAKLKRYKDEHGIGFVDPRREEEMLDARLREQMPAWQTHWTSDDYVEMSWYAPTVRLYVARPMLAVPPAITALSMLPFSSSSPSSVLAYCFSPGHT